MSSGFSIDMEIPPTLAEVMRSHGIDPEGEGRALYEGLLIREDLMADHVRIAGAMFGAHPPIVSEVIATIGLGTPLDEEQRTFIRQQFVHHMTELRRQYEEDLRRRQQGED